MKITIHDEEGNILPSLDPASDVAQLIVLLEYARKRKFQLATVQIGEVIVQVRDLVQMSDASREDGKGSGDSDIWAEHGHQER